MSNTTKTILVTGANGTVGSDVVQALLARGARVRAGVRSLDKGAALVLHHRDGRIAALETVSA